MKLFSSVTRIDSFSYIETNSPIFICTIDNYVPMKLLYQQSCPPENLHICGTNFVPDFCFLIWCRNMKLKLSTNNWLAEYVLLYPRIQLNLFRQYIYFMIKYFSQVSVISYWVSTYIWDFISFLFPSTFAIILFYVFGMFLYLHS